MHHLKRLQTRHHEVLRLSIAGLKNTEIGHIVGLSPVAVSCILRSPIAQAELRRLKDMADESATNIPLKIALANELKQFGKEALIVQRGILNDSKVDLKLRSKVAAHAMDKIIFAGSEDEDRGGSIRDVLRTLDKVVDHIKNTAPINLIDVTPREVSPV